MKMLSEHEPHGVSESFTGGEVYQPSPEEEKLVRKCNALVENAKRGKAKHDWCWPDYYKMFRGRQWKEQRPSYRAAEVFNLMWQTVQSQVPIMLDARPKFEFLPQEPSDREFADLMNDIAAADWAKYNWGFTLTEVIYDMYLYGTGLSSLKYDPKKNCLLYKSESPFYLFPDPAAENFHHRCSYAAHIEPMPVQKIKRLFPDRADFIKADVVNFASEKRIDLTQNALTSAGNDLLYIDAQNGNDNNTIAEVLVKTIYAEDDEVIEEAVADGAEGSDAEPRMQRRLKYPNGRKTVIANEVVLQDGPVEYDDECIFPYQRVINYILPRSFWGISEFEPLEGPQKTFNKIVSYVLDVMFLMGNPIWVVSTDSGIDVDNLTNQPGLVVEKHPGSEVTRQEGTQLQPYVLQMIDRMKELFDDISGSKDIMGGVAPGGVTAASAIADLQNAAQTRMRAKMKNLDAYLQDFGQAYASRVLQFYTAPKVYRLTGKDGSEQYFKMHMTRDEQGQQTAMVQRFTENGQLHPDVEVYQLRGKLDVRVTTGSSLPFSKVENQNRAYALFDRGIIDAEEVLKTLDYPNWESIQQRMQEKAAAQAQAEAQAAPPPQNAA